MSQREYSLRSKTPQQQKLDYYVRKRKQNQNETATPPKKSNSPKMTLRSRDKENYIPSSKGATPITMATLRTPRGTPRNSTHTTTPSTNDETRLPTPRKRNAGKPVACRQLLLHPLDPPTPVDSTQTTPQIKDESSSPSTPRKQIAPIDQALCALHHTIPDKLISRDKEISEIKSFLKQCTSKCIPASMYICGPPGTGKSVSLMHLLSQEKALLENVEVIVLNCVSIGSSQSIFGKIAEKLKIKRKPFDKELTSFFTKPSDSMILLVLDEIDQLSQSILYAIFEWPSLPDSRCILIGIANTLDLTDRTLPRLKLHSNAVSLLLFPPYSKEQIVDIIKERLTDCHVIDETAVQLCARKISSSSGDIRKALDICSKAIEMVQSSDGAIVTINIMSKAFDEVYQAINKDMVMNTMPLHQKLIACAIVLCIREKSNNKEIPLIKVCERYMNVCKSKSIRHVSQSEVVNALEMLESAGIILIKKCKETIQNKISLRLQEDELTHVLDDKVLINSILF